MTNPSTGFGFLSLLLALPLLSGIAIAFIPDAFGKAIKAISIALSGIIFGASLSLIGQFDPGTFHFQMVEVMPWMPQFGIQYKLGVDGISFWLILLTTLLTFLSAIFSLYIEKRVKAYFVMVFLLETAMLGVFTSLDLILFYSFFEASLIPMALMIWIWGGENRNKAALKFFIYTFAASIFMLVGMIVLAGINRDAGGAFTFDLIELQANAASGALWAKALPMQALLFWSFAIAFMVKCPMFPFHTWLPDAHTEAPTAGSIILAGVLLKMGTYGFLRFLLPLFPDVASGYMPAWEGGPSAPMLLMILAVIGIIYGAAVAAMQTDVKRLVAYSSVSHMGFVVLGIFSLNHTGIVGGAYQQLNHGISTGALFLLIGLLYERIHTRMFKDMGGLKSQMPIYAALFLIVMFSSVGLPGTNGFIGEFLAMLGAFQSGIGEQFGLNWILPSAAATGVVLAAIYLLIMFKKVFYGEVTNPALTRLKDLKPWEIGLVGVFVVFIFWGGLYPSTFTRPMEKALNAARQMAINKPGERPAWGDLSQDIHDQGHLVRVAPRVAPAGFTNAEVVEVLNDGSFYQVVAPSGDVPAEKPHAEGEH